MSALPEWLVKLKKEDDEAMSCEEVPSGALAYEALAIAWEALREERRLRAWVEAKPDGVIYKTELLHPGPCKNEIAFISNKMKDAMRRIEDLGRETV